MSVVTAVSRQSALLAYARLLRLPNLFTAVADPLAGWLVVGGGLPAWEILLLVGASGCLYTGGIVFNDVFDYWIDRQERPQRPLPSGAIRRRTAAWLGTLLMLTGLALAAWAGDYAFGIALFLAVMIFFYNSWAKQFIALGPLVLGCCRFANFLLGMRFAPPRMWWMPGVLGLYVVVVALLARREVEHPQRQPLIKFLLLGIIVVDAALVASQGDWLGALIVVSLLVPAAALGRSLAMT